MGGNMDNLLHFDREGLCDFPKVEISFLNSCRSLISHHPDLYPESKPPSYSQAWESPPSFRFRAR